MENSQKIKKRYSGVLKCIRIYLELLSVMNELRLTKKELQFLAWLITSNEYKREDFINTFDSSEATVVKILKRLRKIGLISKDKIPQVHPALKKIDFSSTFTLNLIIENEAS